MRADRRPAFLDGPDDDAPAISPFADLLFALTAAVIPVIIVLLSAVHLAGNRDAAAIATPADSRDLAIVAGRDGVTLLPAGRHVPTDALADDATLADALAAERTRGAAPLVVIEPDGGESAFALEPVLAAAGIARIEQRRGTARCLDAGGTRLLAACRGRDGTR